MLVGKHSVIGAVTPTQGPVYSFARLRPALELSLIVHSDEHPSPPPPV